MGKIVAIDYGVKRVGVAVTDSLKIIATPLKTVLSSEILIFLKSYTVQEDIEALVVGMPKRLDNTASPMTAIVERWIKTLRNIFPDKPIIPQDERYTSRIALASMVAGGFKKKDRRNKDHIDKLSATVILQSFLASQAKNRKL